MIAKELVTVLRFQLEKSGLNRFLQGLNQAKAKAQQTANEINNKLRLKQLSNHDAIFNRGMQKLDLRTDATILNEIRRAQLAYKALERSGRATHNELNRAAQATRQRIADLRNELKGADGNGGLGGFSALISGAIGAGLVANFTQTADAISGAIAQASMHADAGNADKVMKQIYANAQSAGTSWQSGVDMYGSVARSKKDLGLDDAQAVKLSDTVSKAVAMTSKGAGQDSAAILQFSQALASGVLRGDELNSILENSGGLAMAIADSFGVSVGELRKMGQAGKLSSKEMAEGLLKQSDKINEKFNKMPATFGQGITRMQNAWARLVNDLNKGSGASQVFYEICGWIADRLESIASFAGFAALSWGLTAIKAKLIAATVSAGGLRVALHGVGQAMKTSLLPMLKMAALLYGLYLIGEDIWVWANGGESVFGDLIGPVKEWKDELEWVKQKFIEIKDFLGGAGDTFSEWGAKMAMAGSVGYVLFKALSLVLGVVRLISAAMMMNPWVLAILAIVAAVYLLYTHWDTVVAYFLTAWEWIKAAGVAVWDWIVQTALAAWDAIWWAISAYFGWILNLATTVWTSIWAFVQAVWDWILVKAIAIWTAIVAAAYVMWENIKAKAQAAWDYIKTTAIAIWDGIVAAVNAAWDSAVAYFTSKWQSAAGAIKSLFDWIPGLGSGGINVNHTVSAAQMATAGAGGGNRTVNQTNHVSFASPHNSSAKTSQTLKAANDRAKMFLRS